ncbi:MULTISPECIES: bifunctional 4-hydroxy-2-oxoglutarate aldolase/2-dehydro-3-deoxy-phosphogluconate aldolase [Ramlibacter]|uniref:2-dehydro-3-deoxy-phosphogluconate aldolase n=1 Tax=Ramlibacter aquaticus TaxID=2780094 RepID=A0ABR9SGE9_9BURK|nr:MULTISPECIES: bifunctional 4-hydroxy-2-oxoglutarate aldolase/2-dehydro-3-deoxy-phosphogluconate aldolase [Ramlibacter]MBE7941424.1 bifunctional 4-hydroxy-2-oxoglutarate aldolase/2-dehydro-3-deoxy-phosphogluconate aldolase [Ramlibacter aquaticus]
MSLPSLPPFRSRVVPVVVVADVAQAVPMARALLAGGIDVIEITLRSSAGLAAIEAVARAVPGMHVGAGTVTRASEVRQVLDAGAAFGLSPGATPALLEAVRAEGLPFVPGVASPSEAMAARDAGFTLLKCFPAAQLGGIEVLKAWAGPLPELRFCPTGGISLANLAQFLALPNVAMAGGSWLTPAAALQAGDWARVEQLAREASALANATPA